MRKYLICKPCNFFGLFLSLFLFLCLFENKSFSSQFFEYEGKNFFISDNNDLILEKKTGSLVDVFNINYAYFSKKKNNKIDFIVEVKVGAPVQVREYKYINYDTNCKIKNQIYIKKRSGDGFNCWFIGAYDYFKDQDNFEETWSNPHDPPTFMFNGGIKYFLKKNNSKNTKFIKSSHNFFSPTKDRRHYVINYLVNYENLLNINQYNQLKSGNINEDIKKKLINKFSKFQKEFEKTVGINNLKKYALDFDTDSQIVSKINSSSISRPKVTQNDFPEIITKSSIVSNDPNYTLKGSVKDKSGAVYLKVDGKFVDIINGKFEIKRFSPVDEKVSLIATNKWGNKIKKDISVKINLSDNILSKNFSKLLPKKIKVSENSNTIALIIGIEKYKNTPHAKYANLDTKYFYEYARNTFGIKNENIKLLIDDNASLVDTISALSKWLPPRVKSGKTNIIVFYSGHGLAAPDGKNLYFLPYDTDVDLLSRSAISRSEFFKELIKHNPENVTMFLDTCYSGVSRDEKILLASARPIRIKVSEEYDAPEKFNIFSASDLNQISSGIKEAKHGIFSYYLMKGLEGNADENVDGKITNGELHEYLNSNVPKYASSIGRKQSPSFIGDNNRILVQYK